MNQTLINLAVALAIVSGIFIVLPLTCNRIKLPLPNNILRASHSLLLFSSIAIIPMFAMVEMSGRYGIMTLLVLVIFGLLDMLSPIVLSPVQWFTNHHKISGLTDILVYRFRGRMFGRFITTVLILAALPLAMAHILAVFELIELLLNIQDNIWLDGFIALFLCLLLLGFAAAQKDLLTMSPSLTFPMICGALLILISLIVITLIIVQQVFGGIISMNHWVEDNAQYQKLLRIENAPALMALFFAANIVLPQFYRIRSNVRSQKTLGVTAWLFPLILLVSSLPMFPLLWSGIELNAEVPLQMYATLLPTLIGNPWATTLAVTAGLVAAISGLSMLLFSLTQPTVFYLAMPKTPDFSQKPLYRWLKLKSLSCFALLLALSLLGYFLLNSRSITDLLLVSLAGLSHLAPGLIATFYFPSINRKAVAIGLCTGITFWFVSLFLPLFMGEWVISLSPYYKDLTFGVSNFTDLLYEALTLNICVCIVVSLLTTMSESEKYYANTCMVDNLPEPRREALKQCSIDDVQHELGKLLGPDIAANQINKLINQMGIQQDENRPSVLRQFRDRQLANLNELIGCDAAYKVMDQAFPVLSSKTVFNNLLTLENLLDVAGNRLSGLSEKMNKLRLYHRHTLENMPIGVCAIDDADEIMFWNHSLETFTGISSQQAQGCLVTQLPEPWRELFTHFLADEDKVKYALEVPLEGISKWCNLSKATIEIQPEDNASSQVLLLEDVSEVVMLNRGLIHSERLASVGRLAAGVAHEIGNPVTGIACLAQDILSDQDEQEVLNNAKQILEQTRRITAIVQSLTTYSRTDGQTTQVFGNLPLRTPIAEAISLLDLRNTRNIQFINQVGTEFITLGDSHQLTQVFLNLLTNAYDASPEYGQIVIQAQYLGDNIEIKVIDEGEGIPENIRDLVFEPFFTTKDVGKGTGLGLSLVHDIITLHHGEIAIKTTEQGNALVIKLPRSFTTADAGDHNIDQR